MSELDIKAAVKRSGLAHAEIAARLGVSVSAFRQYLSGNPSVKVLQAVAAAIGCDIVDLFTNTPNSGECRCPVCGAALRLTVK